MFHKICGLFFPAGSAGKEYVYNVGNLGLSLGQEDPLEKGMTIHSSVLSGESHGQGSLAGYSSLDHKESDTTE